MLTREQLPVRLTPMVGRESELNDIVAALARSRLLALTGLGGTGKTPLALAPALPCADVVRAWACHHRPFGLTGFFYNPAVADEEGGAFELGTDGPQVILVGVDDSVTSLRAGAYAAGLARRQGARLVCVFVEQRATIYGATGGAGASAVAAQDQATRETGEDLRRRAEQEAERLGLRLTFIIAHGDPYHELRRVADEVRADAVIVGASAKAGHRWVGSLAVRLVKAGRWPVTVVP